MESQTEVTRVCQFCGIEKPISEFAECSLIESGYLWRCNSCVLESWVAFVQHTRPKKWIDKFKKKLEEDAIEKATARN